MRMNESIHHGIVAADPLVMRNEEGQAFASLRLICISNPELRTGKRGKAKAFDFVMFKSRNPKVVEAMQDAKKGDLCYVAGVVTTDFCQRVYNCPACGKSTAKDGLQTYITPVEFNIIYKGAALDEEGAFNNDKASSILDKFKEKSNYVVLAGILPQEPIPYKVKNEFGLSNCTATQIAVRRKYRLLGEVDPERITDWPYLHFFGRNSKLAQLYMKKGSVIQIRGYIRARRFKKKVICEHCGNEIEKDQISCDITVYKQPEFISGTRTEEEVQEIINIRRIQISDENDDEITLNKVTKDDIESAEEIIKKIDSQYKLPEEVT